MSHNEIKSALAPLGLLHIELVNTPATLHGYKKQLCFFCTAFFISDYSHDAKKKTTLSQPKVNFGQRAGLNDNPHICIGSTEIIVIGHYLFLHFSIIAKKIF